MTKQGLGRDLGTLMRPSPKETAAPVSAGVRSLMRGHNLPVTAVPVAPVAPKAAPIVPATTKAVIPRWYLFAGDLLLVALALLTVYKSPHPLSWPRALFCTTLVVLAAVLAIMALWMPEDKMANFPSKL
jgi:hypothetical protein